jgi:hypothetical protein
MHCNFELVTGVNEADLEVWPGGSGLKIVLLGEPTYRNTPYIGIFKALMAVDQRNKADYCRENLSSTATIDSGTTAMRQGPTCIAKTSRWMDSDIHFGGFEVPECCRERTQSEQRIIKETFSLAPRVRDLQI